MSARGFLTLFIATVIGLVAAIALVVSEQVAASNDRRAGGPMFPELAERLDEVAQVTIESPQYTLVLEQRDGRWVAADRGSYPVIIGPAETFVSGLASLVEYEGKTSNPDLYAALAVTGPGPDRQDTRVVVTAANGDVLVDAILGIPASAIGQHTRGGMYVRRSDEERVWLAEGAARPPTFVSEFFEQLFSISGPTLSRFAVYSGETLLLDATKVDFVTGDYELTYIDPSVGPQNAVAADSRIRNMSQSIVSVSFVNVRTIDEVTVAPDAQTFLFTTQDGLTLTVTLSEPDANGVQFVIFHASAEPGTAAEARAAEIAAKTEGYAFQLASNRYISLTLPVTTFFTIPAEAPAPAPVTPAPLVPLPPTPGP